MIRTGTLLTALATIAASLPAAGLRGDEIDPADLTRGLSEAEIRDGFVNIFDGRSLAGWVGLRGSTDSYYAKDEMLVCKDTGKEHIFTAQEYGDFVLRLEIRLDSGGNNGIGVRCRVSPQPHLEGNELQVLDDSYFPCWKQGRLLELKEYQYHGSLYGVLPAKRGALKPPGEWNEQEIVCRGRQLTVTLNGQTIVDCDLDQVQPIDGQAHPGLKYARGRIGLHAHGNYGAEVFFRKLRVKRLD